MADQQKKHQSDATKPAKSKSPNHAIAWVSGLAIVIAIVALIVGSYGVYTLIQQHRRVTAMEKLPILRPSAIQFLSQDLTALKNEQASFKSELTTQATALTALQTQFTQVQNTLREQQQAFRSINQPNVTRQELDWASARVSLNLAAQALQFQRPLPEAQQALDEAWYDLRNNADMSTLRSLQGLMHQVSTLPTLQTQNAIEQLDILQNQLSALSFKLPVSAAPANSAPQNGSENAFRATWNHVKSMMVIRHDNTIGQELLTDSARLNAVTELQLFLAKARWQILQASPEYQDTLQALMHKVQDYTQITPVQQTWLKHLFHIQQLPVMYPQKQVDAILQQIQSLQMQLSKPQ